MDLLLSYQKKFLMKLIVNVYKVENRYKSLNNYHKYKLALSKSKDGISKYDVAYSIQMSGPDNNCYGDNMIPFLTFGANLNKCDFGRLSFDHGYKGQDELLTIYGKSCAKRLINRDNY